MTLAEEVAAIIAEDEWRTHGLQDVRIGVTREGLAKNKLLLAERIVEHVRQAIEADDKIDVDLLRKIPGVIFG